MRARSVFLLAALPLLTGCCAFHHLGTGCGHGHGGELRPPSTPAAEGEYTCPMHPEVRASFATTCPECGMELVKE
ncbi:MAG: hypothetical protein L0Y66_26165 [Myxococcaceae bacterium]|nr:hypothetical protein [Myxococcaceae bacterium]